jgi:transposase
MQYMDRLSLESFLNEGLSLAEIGKRLGRHESTVAYWAHKHGLQAANMQKHAARGRLTREDLLVLVETGLSIAEIAVNLDRSKATIRYWLRRYDLKTWSPSGGRRKAESEAARQAGLTEAQMLCKKNGQSGFVVDGRGNTDSRGSSSTGGVTSGVVGAGPRRSRDAAAG